MATHYHIDHAGLGQEPKLAGVPGHSGDSVSLLLDAGAVFTGDLTAPAFVSVEDPAVVAASWLLLRERGATTVYPGHGPIRPMP